MNIPGDQTELLLETKAKSKFFPYGLSLHLALQMKSYRKNF